MGERDPRVDAYIAKSADFAKPILSHIRSLVHEACPHVEETIKWSMPHFEYEGILCGMGVRRLDLRSEGTRHAEAACRYRGRVDGRREVAELEIQKTLRKDPNLGAANADERTSDSPLPVSEEKS